MTQPAAQPPNTPDDSKNRYRGTLNLPKTAFPMKANLVQNEPASQKRWDALNLYQRLRQARAGQPRFVFHDGPPYANGSIHIGHMMNKVLKDLVVRSRSMAGLDCPYVPGWDCHGLPIEHKVMTEFVESGKIAKLRELPESQRRLAVRRECAKYAEKFQKLQAAQMRRLSTLADYDHPYMTMDRAGEGATLEVLAGLVEQGLVYRALKPVHWSPANETALAEAELEYEDRTDLSVYVDFEAADANAVYEAFALPPADDDEDDESPPAPGRRPAQRPCFMIWTTTPWTLPANLAIAVNPKFEYALVWIDGNVTVMASDAVQRVAGAAKAEDSRVLATTTGQRLLGLEYQHPFVDRAAHAPAKVFRVVAADYVTLEDGTGLVHTAPGHGAEDFQTGARESLPVYCPVRGDGSYDSSVPDWLRGLDIWKANPLIVERLRQSGHLFFDHAFKHSYPHDWRSKTPVIFRCTEQWFIGVDRPTRRDGQSLRALALDWTAQRVGFVPEWGRNRMRGMLETRPDWCISRQRSWGLPIPAFFWNDASGAEHCLLTPASVRAVAAVIREKGADAWFAGEPLDLLKSYDPARDPDAPAGLQLAALRKGGDILDVWFESGSTWNSVMRERARGGDFPCALYLEGSDQHRGWFQSSLLPALGMMGRPPFETLLTHGFMVDKDGRKMSKSLGNTLDVEDLLKDFGADVCRWWVASLSYENDIKVDRGFFDAAGESYRKVRNTLRFMLSNLGDFSPAGVSPPAPESLDAWVLSELDALSRAVQGAYERYAFSDAHKALFDFCNDTLSAVYLSAVKDRLYCDRPGSARRRRTQATLFTLTDSLSRLLAPILCHTADEAYLALFGLDPKSTDRCVHLERFLPPSTGGASEAWARFMSIRGDALAALERAKATGIENPLDAAITLPDPSRALAGLDARDLADLLGVSRVSLDGAGETIRVQDLRDQPRCERSWKRDGTVRQRADGGMLSDRDAEAVGV